MKLVVGLRINQSATQQKRNYKTNFFDHGIFYLKLKIPVRGPGFNMVRLLTYLSWNLNNSNEAETLPKT